MKPEKQDKDFTQDVIDDNDTAAREEILAMIASWKEEDIRKLVARIDAKNRLERPNIDDEE